MIADVDAFTSTTVETYVLVDVSTRRPDVYIAPGEELRGDLLLLDSLGITVELIPQAAGQTRVTSNISRAG